MCKALPAYHAFTGSDFTPFFSRKRKIQLLKLEKDERAQIVFGHLGELDAHQSNDFTEVGNFTSEMNSKKKLKKINDVKRFFWKNTSQISDGDKISCAKNLMLV